MTKPSTLILGILIAGSAFGCAAEAVDADGSPTAAGTDELCILFGQPEGTSRCGDTEEFLANEAEMAGADGFLCGEGHGCDFRSGWFGTNEDWCGQRGHAFTVSTFSRDAVARPTVAVAEVPEWRQDLLIWDGGDILCRPAVAWPAAIDDEVMRYDYECFSSGTIGGWMTDLAYDAAIATVAGTVGVFAFSVGGAISAVAAAGGGTMGVIAGLASLPLGVVAGVVGGLGAGAASFASHAWDPSALDCATLSADPAGVQWLSVEGS